MWVWKNGEWTPSSKLPLLLENRGFLFGEGLFETIKIKRSKPIFLSLHLERMKSSSLSLHIPLPFTLKKIESGVRETISRNGLKEGILRIILTPLSSSSLLLLWTEEGNPYEEKRSFRALLSSFTRNERSPLISHKTLNSYENFLARREAIQEGYDEAILLNRRSEVAEGAFSNIFLVKGETLLTPPLSSGCFPGITRRKILEIARREKVEVKETFLTLRDLEQAEGIFFTSSLMGIMPCKEMAYRMKKGIHRIELPPEPSLVFFLKERLSQEEKSLY